LTYRRLSRVVRRLCWGLRPRAEENGFASIRTRFYQGFWKEAAAAAGADLRELEDGYREARRGAAATVIRDGQIALDDELRAGLARNKTLVARLLEPFGFTTPESVVFDPGSLRPGLDFLCRTGGPLVVKPDGAPKSRFVVPGGPGAGRGITCGVRTPRQLARAARWASLFGERLIVEKEIAGASYRLLYLDGELIDAIRRDPPRVFGDGLSTIAELIHTDNAERKLAWPPLALHPLACDLDCHLTLEHQGLSAKAVPRAMQPVKVKTVCNQNAAYDNHVAREAIHPALARIGAEFVRRLGLRLAGVDLLSADPSRPPEERGLLFNEVNANPGLHHHWLVAETEQRAPVGALVLQAALS
jgi:hypothetical protein